METYLEKIPQIETQALEIIRSNALTLTQKAEALELRTVGDFEAACSLLALAKNGVKQAEQVFTNTKRGIDALKKGVLDDEKALVARFKPAQDILDRKILDYRAEQQRKAREEEARRMEEARRRAEEEKLQEALLAEACDGKEAADEVLAAPVYVIPPAPAAQVPKAAGGISFRKVWKGRVVDPKKLPEEYKLPNFQAIDNHARSLKERANIPGVEFYCEEVTARSPAYRVG